MAISLARAVETLQELAPLEYAESWDNVGLLVEPPRPPPDVASVSRVLLTIDLTDAVLDEATGCELIVSYHPPIFKAVQRLVCTDPVARRLATLIQRKTAVYSPHTALDAARGGINDWLVSALGPGQVAPIAEARRQAELKVVVFVPEAHVRALRDELADAGAGVIGNYDSCSFNLRGTGTFRGNADSNPTLGRRQSLETVEEVRLEMVCAAEHLAAIGAAIRRHHPYEEPAWDVYPLEQRPVTGVGIGRRVELETKLTVDEAVARVKAHLGLRYVRLAKSPVHAAGGLIAKAAVCAGAGGSVLGAAGDVDLVVSGELRHHDILAWTARGCSVIVCDHTNTERGFLPVLAERLREAWGQTVSVDVATEDREPLAIV